MKPVWLIAVNFVRQQRVVIFVFLAWLLGFGLLFGVVFRDPHSREDLMQLFRQQAAYGIVITVFVSASAINGERKSRRILAVLAKGIYRSEYLAGLMLGNAILAGIYFLVVGLINQAFAMEFGLIAHIWPTLGAAMIASILASSLAILLSTFLHPLLTTVFTTAILGAPFVAHSFRQLIPVAFVIGQIMDFDYASGWQGGWHFAVIATVEMILFWALAAKSFAGRDVAVAVD